MNDNAKRRADLLSLTLIRSNAVKVCDVCQEPFPNERHHFSTIHLSTYGILNSNRTSPTGTVLRRTGQEFIGHFECIEELRRVHLRNLQQFEDEGVL